MGEVLTQRLSLPSVLQQLQQVATVTETPAKA
jgi:hypothetical protein